LLGLGDGHQRPRELAGSMGSRNRLIAEVNAYPRRESLTTT
jgi:hypothetical protein